VVYKIEINSNYKLKKYCSIFNLDLKNYNGHSGNSLKKKQAVHEKFRDPNFETVLQIINF